MKVGKGEGGGGVERVLELKRQKKKVASSETTEGEQCLSGGGSL